MSYSLARLVKELKQSAQAFRSGEFLTGAALAERGYREALSKQDLGMAARFLGNLGGCRFALHEYQPALEAYVRAHSLAEASGDHTVAANLELNISSLYSQMGEMDAAVQSATQALAHLRGDDRSRLLPSWLVHLAHLQADQDRIPEAMAYYREGIAAADRAGDTQTLSDAWDDVGFDYLKRQELRQAEAPLLEAYRVRKLNRLRSIEGSYRNLGMLRMQQGDLPQASQLLDEAVRQSLAPGGLKPAWEVYHARGRVRLTQNRLVEALDDLRIAARLARTWRRATLPDDATRVSTEGFVQRVHASLIEAGSRLYFQTGRPGYARETFESAEANRASSLRAVLAGSREQRAKLPPEYWETLRKLESVEVELIRQGADRSLSSKPDSPAGRVQQLRGSLIRWESQSGSNPDVEIPDLLEHTRGLLRPDAAYFAFHLATPNSYLWVLSPETFALYRLPPAPQITALADAFIHHTRQAGSEAGSSGALLFRQLFGQIDPLVLTKPRWLLALDARLFEVPLAALVVETHAGRPVFLAERHTLQIVSGAEALERRGDADLPGPFLGIADPIYNTADRRWKGKQPASLFGLFSAQATDTRHLPLARLVGSAREAAACASAWNGIAPAVLLEGAAATRQRLQAELRTPPAVLHFATHFLHSTRDVRSGLIALSLDDHGEDQVLGPVEMAAWDLRGAVVSLSGCSSGAGSVLPATGLMGLTRASLAAGARAVVASRWPTPDDAGALFVSFYRYLRSAPRQGAAAALQRAQVEMLRSDTWRASPAYWAAYFVTGNRQ